MWLSKRIAKGENDFSAESGKITLSNGSETEADASAVTRGLDIYAPYGYAASLPVGEEILMVPSSGRGAVLGVKSNASGLQPGEIKIASKGGANIVLKNDGSVVINGTFKISKEGTVISE